MGNARSGEGCPNSYAAIVVLREPRNVSAYLGVGVALVSCRVWEAWGLCGPSQCWGKRKWAPSANWGLFPALGRLQRGLWAFQDLQETSMTLTLEWYRLLLYTKKWFTEEQPRMPHSTWKSNQIYMLHGMRGKCYTEPQNCQSLTDSSPKSDLFISKEQFLLRMWEVPGLYLQQDLLVQLTWGKGIATVEKCFLKNYKLWQFTISHFATSQCQQYWARLTPYFSSLAD